MTASSIFFFVYAKKLIDRGEVFFFLLYCKIWMETMVKPIFMNDK